MRMCVALATTNDMQQPKNTATTATTGTPMMMNTTIEQLRGLRLAGMASGLQEQLSQAGIDRKSVV